MSEHQDGDDDKGQTSKQIWFMNNDAPDAGIYSDLKNLAPDADLTKNCSKERDDKCKSDEIQENQASRSPEIFVPDDNIINTQESCDLEITNLVSSLRSRGVEFGPTNSPVKQHTPVHDSCKGTFGESVGQRSAVKLVVKETGGTSKRCDISDVLGLLKGKDEAAAISTGKDEAKANLIQERRSGRLKKDTTISTMEKVDMMAKKRNLEGNNVNTNSFSVLPVDDLLHSAADMGVVANSDNLETFDLLKTLEFARNDVYQKQHDLDYKS
jgi:hypothetical protein